MNTASLSILARRALAIALVGGLLGCVTPTREARRLPTGDELLAAGDLRGAADAYERERALATEASEKARAQLFRAVALLSSGEAKDERQGLELLASLEHDPEGGVWGHVARALAAEMARSEVLRRTVMRAGADVEELRTRLELSEEALAASDANARALEERRAALQEELSAAQRRLRELEAELAAREEKLRQLEEELSALKDIDMQREP